MAARVVSTSPAFPAENRGFRLLQESVRQYQREQRPSFRPCVTHSLGASLRSYPAGPTYSAVSRTLRVSTCDYSLLFPLNLGESRFQSTAKSTSISSGNICRSPAAEAVFRHIVEKEGLSDHFSIDSAGTIDYHEGNPADSRMRKAAAERGMSVTSISRPIKASDFEEFDYILAMDKQNLSDIQRAYQNWSKRGSLPPDGLSKVGLMCNYCKKSELQEVPDPYYGGAQGFELVLDLLDDACSQFLKYVKPKISA